MKDALTKLGADVAVKLAERFQSDDMKKFLADTKAAGDSETGTFEVVITTENLDRYGEVISLSGWELEHYRKNPVVLWGHDHDQPIGLATSVEITDGKMVAKGKFGPTEKAQEVRRLYEFGIIKATSVGFIVKEQEGNLITKAELLEFSFVSVPANPFALSLAMEKGLQINELVTRGLMHVEKDAEETPAEEVTEEPKEEPAPVVAEPPTQEEGEKKLDPKAAAAVSAMKAAIVALEAPGDGEPEGDVVADQEAREFAAFRENRKLLQTVATAVGDALADARQHVEASRKAA